jgi:hypothetical protein
MKVLIAGASGAIGRPLIRCLRENRHAVIALVRSPESSRAVAEAGAEPVIADAMRSTLPRCRKPSRGCDRMRSITQPGCAAPRTTRRNGNCSFGRGRSSGFREHNRNPDCPEANPVELLLCRSFLLEGEATAYGENLP